MVDVAVVGAGLMGSATAYAAARRGLSVALIEQFPLGHDRGSSHGSARIVRRAYADALYVGMSGEALELWHRLQSDSGTQLLRMTGGIDHGRRRDLPGIVAALDAHRVGHELLDPESAMARWPGMTFDGPVLHHGDAGTVDAAGAVAAFCSGARERGADVRDSSPVTALEVTDDIVTLTTGTGVLRARTVVVAAGSWVGALLGGVIALPALTVTQQQVFHFPRRDGDVSWPVAVHKDAMSTYSLPGGRDGTGPAGSDARKVAEHDAGPVTTPELRDGVVDPAARERITAYVRNWLPGLVPEPFAEATCLYTSTSNEDFVIDRDGPVVVVSPCSGHGAKFAPLVGELAADLVMGVGQAHARFRLRADASMAS